MATALDIATRFTAVDKFTPAVKKMQAATTSFGRKATASFAMVERQERKLRKGVSSLLGKFGQLGLALSGLLIVTQIATANIQLEKSLASLSAITGVTGDAFNDFRREVAEVSKAQKIFAGDTAKAFEIVGSAKPELLVSADALAKVTEASIILSKASGDDLTLSAENLTGAMNQFNLTADQATRTINALAAGSVVGSANITKINESLTGFGAVANAANITLEESIGLVETLGTKSLFGAEAGTALRGTILRLQAAGVGYQSGVFNINDALEEAKKKSDSFSTAIERDAYMLKTFGQRNIVTGNILLENIDKFKQFTAGVTGTNTAFEQADIKANTLSNRLDEVKAAFLNATTSTDANNTAMSALKNVLVFVSDNMTTIIGVISTAIGVFAAYKAIMIASRIATFAFSVAQGLAAVGSGAVSIAVGKNAVALGVYTAAQWLANAALWGFPLTWILAAVAAVIAIIVLLVNKWSDMVEWIKTSDNWFAKLLRASIYPIIAAFKLVKAAISIIIDAFRGLVEWVKTSDSWFAKFIRFGVGALVTAFKALGAALSWVGDMFKKVWEWIKKIASQALGPVMDLINLFSGETQKELGVDVNRTTEVLNPDATAEKIRTERIEKTSNDKLSIDINNNTGFEANVEQTGNIPVQLTPTM